MSNYLDGATFSDLYQVTFLNIAKLFFCVFMKLFLIQVCSIKYFKLTAIINKYNII